MKVSFKKIGLMALIFLAIIAIGFGFGFSSANAEEICDDIIVNEEVSVAEAAPRILTRLILNLNCADGYMTASVNNAFTLGFSTVEVYVYLYHSTNQVTSYSQMTRVAYNYTADLNIFETIVAQVAYDSNPGYWMAVTKYNINNDGWKEENAGLYYYDGNGNRVLI